MLCFLIQILTISNQLKAQYPKLEISVTVINESGPGKSDAEILISTEGEKPPYIYQLFDKEPWNGGKEIAKSKKTIESKYVFKNLKPGSYFICATDNEDNSDCDIIRINNE